MNPILQTVNRPITLEGKSTNFYYLLIPITTLILFLYFTENSVVHDYYWQIQVPVFLEINSVLSGWPLFWKNITALGDASVCIPILCFVFRVHRRTWAALFAAVPVSGLLSILAKNAAAMPRPAAVIPHDQFEIIGKVLSGHNSLPSGHTLAIFSVATVIVVTFFLPKQNTQAYIASYALGTIAVLVGVSRVAVGAHWPVDVLIGAYLGIVGGLGGIYLLNHFSTLCRWANTTSAQRVLCIVLFGWGAVLFVQAFDGERFTLTVLLASICAFATAINLALNETTNYMQKKSNG